MYLDYSGREIVVQNGGAHRRPHRRPGPALTKGSKGRIRAYPSIGAAAAPGASASSLGVRQEALIAAAGDIICQVLDSNANANEKSKERKLETAVTTIVDTSTRIGTNAQYTTSAHFGAAATQQP